MTPRDHGRRRGRSSVSLFLVDFNREKGFRKKFFRSCVCACVRPSVQKPAALQSVDLESPKPQVLTGEIPFNGTLTSLVLLRKKEPTQKMRYLPPKCFIFCEIRNSHIFPAASPRRVLTSLIGRFRITAGTDSVRPWRKA